MSRKTTVSLCGAILGLMLAMGASAQDTLPLPPTPSGSKAGLTMET